MKVFLSCVTREFGSYRLRLAEQLGALAQKRFDVKVQEDFVQGGFTLLDQLAAYIRECDLVIHLVGDLAGAQPSEEHVRAMFERLGEPASEPLPTLSYTQWEYELARRFGRRMLCYLATAEAGRDCAGDPQGCGQTEEDARLQVTHRERIEREGKHYSLFAGHHNLIRTVFHDLELSPSDKANNLPYASIGSLFKGRDEFLEKLRQTLGEAGHRGARRAAAITGAPAAAVHGLGGIGKTRAAVEYAHRYWDEYTALLFVVADSSANLDAQLARLTGATVLNLPEKDEREQAKQVAAVVRWLQRNPGWLLILDNVDSEEAAKAVEELLGRLSGSGQVVITSRLSRWGGEVEPLDLDLLSEEAAVQFLLESTDTQRRKEPDDATRAGEIALELGQLALALEQAAASINARHWNFARYQSMWRENRDRMLREHDTLVQHYPKSVAITWLTSFEQLSENGRRLLRVLAWLAPDPIPRSLLEAGGGPFAAEREEEVPKEQQPELVLEAEDALADIETYSLATSSKDKLSFSIHRLVQDVTRRNTPEAEIRAVLAAALRWVSDGFEPEADVRVPYLPAFAPLIPHAKAVADHAESRGIPKPPTLLMKLIQVMLYSRSRLSEANLVFSQVIADDRTIYGTDQRIVASRLHNFALMLQNTGHLAEGEPLMRRALATLEECSASDDPDVATCYHNLATILYDARRAREAEPLMRHALDIRERRLGKDHPATQSSAEFLTWILQAQRRL